MGTATLDEPEHGLTRRRPRGDGRADLVGPRRPRRGRRRGRRPGPAAGPRRDGPDRPPLGPPLEDLPAADGHERRPQVARGGRARADLGRRPGASDRRRAGRVVRPRRGGDVRRAVRRPGAGPARAGQLVRRAARCSGAAAAGRAAGAGSSTSGRATRPTRRTSSPDVRQVIANAVRWATGPRGAPITVENQGCRRSRSGTGAGAPSQPATAPRPWLGRRAGRRSSIDLGAERDLAVVRICARSPARWTSGSRTGLPSSSVQVAGTARTAACPRTRHRRSGTAARRARSGGSRGWRRCAGSRRCGARRRPAVASASISSASISVTWRSTFGSPE